MLHECDGSHSQFVFWQALVHFAHSVAPAQRASACGGGSHSVLNSIALTYGCLSFFTENGLHSLHFSGINSICDVAAMKQH